MGGIAHELNSVLLAARTYLDGADRGLPSGDAELAKAVALIHQAQSLSASLLELFAGSERLAAPTTAIGVWLPEIAHAIAEGLPGEISVRTSPSEGAPTVYADPLALEQVLRILIGNAAEAIKGRGEIRLTASRICTEESGGRWAELRVGDQGPGVPRADRGRLFDPSFTTKHRSRRSGLGLSIAARLVSQAGGALSFEPNSPGGAVFVIRLRIAGGGES